MRTSHVTRGFDSGGRLLAGWYRRLQRPRFGQGRMAGMECAAILSVLFLVGIAGLQSISGGVSQIFTFSAKGAMSNEPASAEPPAPEVTAPRTPGISLTSDIDLTSGINLTSGIDPSLPGGKEKTPEKGATNP
jgi:hypothetical protein